MGAKMGRPPVELDIKAFENLCSMQCTREEIADFFKVDEDTVTAWCKRHYGDTFSVVYKKLSAKGKISLRRAQFRLAEKNTSMAIFLGKQYLGQRDNPAERPGNGDIEDLAPLAELLKE